MLKKIIPFFLSLVMLLSLCGCRMDTKSIIWGIEEKEVSFTYDKNVYLATEKIRNLNPLISKDESVYYISKLVFDSIFRLDEKLIPQPLLAESYTYSEDGTELTVHLKKNVQFHDGHALTGEDVKFTIEAIKALAKTGETLYSSHVASIKSVIYSDSNPFDVTIKYSSGYGNGYENLIFPILPAHQFKSVNAIKSASYKMIGTGPYKQSDYLELTSLVLTPYNEYFGSKAESTLHFQIVPNISYATGMADSGDISLFFDDTVNKDSILSKYELGVTTYISNKPDVLGFNCTGPLFSKVEARQAIAYLVDASEILEKAYYKNGVLSDSLFYPDYYGVGNEGDKYPVDPAAAAKLLKKAGLNDTDGDGTLNFGEGENATLNLIYQSSDSFREKAASIIAGELKAAGIAVNVIPCSDAAYYERLSLKDYDLFIGGFEIDERYDLRSILGSAYGNAAGYSNEEVDALLSDLICGIKQYGKSTNVKKLKKIICEELPYYTLLYRADACYLSPYFDGLATPVFNDIYRGCKSWQCKYPESFTDEE